VGNKTQIFIERTTLSPQASFFIRTQGNKPQTKGVVLEMKSVVVHFRGKAFKPGRMLVDVGGGATDKGT
jgi:hypothetical protein